jgi:hypothetical protein
MQEGREFSNECLIVLLIEDAKKIRCLSVVVEIQLCKLFWLDTFPLQWACEMIQSTLNLKVHQTSGWQAPECRPALHGRRGKQFIVMPEFSSKQLPSLASSSQELY